MARAVGLHISKDFVRAAEVEGSARRLKVRSFVEVPVEAPQGTSPEDAVASAIERVFKERKLPRSPVALGLDSGDAMFRDLTVPFVRDDHLKRTLKFELETHVHSHNPDEILVDYVLLARTEKESHVFASALPKTLVGGRLKQLDRLHVDPVVIDLDAFGLVNALSAAGALADRPNVAVVHVDGARARFVVVVGGKLRSARSVLLPTGEDGPPTVRIAQELVRTLSQAAPKEAPAVVWLTGDAGDDAGLRAAVQEKVGVPCESIDLLARCGGEAPADGAPPGRAAVPIGLALRALDASAAGLDFRMEEFAYEKRFDAIKQALVSTAVFLFVMLGLLCIYFHQRTTRTLDDETEVRYLFYLAEIHDRIPLNPQIVDQKKAYDDFDYRPLRFAEADGVFNRIKKRRIELESGRGGNSAVTRTATRYWADLWTVLGDALAEQRRANGTPSEPWLKVTSLNIKVDPPSRGDDTKQSVTIRLSGEVNNLAVLSPLIKSLNESGKFAGVGNPSTQPSPGGGVLFSDWTIPISPENR